MENFDLVVIGVGMAAVSAANKCAAAGWRVAVVDELPYGGTCALRGCDPKKMLRRGAEIIDAARLMRGKGIVDADLQIDWPDLMAFKRTFTDKVPGRIESNLKDSKVSTYHGSARFMNETTIEVEGTQLQGRYVLIATGAQPRPVDVPGAEHLVMSDRFLELEQLPERIFFVGGGFVSFEFAHIARHAGASVRIIDRGARPLKGFDPDLVDKLMARTRAIGIDIQLQTNLSAIEKTNDGFRVAASTTDGTKEWSADLVVHGAGRVPALDRLDPDVAGIEFGAKGVAVNEFLQSVSNPAVYAAGDAADSPGAPLTPVAVFEGKVVASNMLKGNEATPDYRGVPTGVFTLPELTRVGLLESEAKAQGADVRVKFTDTGGWYSNRRIGETCAAGKVIIDNETDKISGAHLLGPEYAELINFFGLAIRLGLTTRDLKKMVSLYPSVGSDLGSLV